MAIELFLTVWNMPDKLSAIEEDPRFPLLWDPWRRAFTFSVTDFFTLRAKLFTPEKSKDIERVLWDGLPDEVRFRNERVQGVESRERYRRRRRGDE